MTKILHVAIKGRVQGVGYRAWTEGRARELGLRGWVRNRRDGSVEAVFKGEEDKVVRMLEDCWRGPRSAVVTEVVATAVVDENWPDFSVRPTA
ncbi:MAG: acylphosphatase [Pseudomonadota bacterium]